MDLDGNASLIDVQRAVERRWTNDYVIQAYKKFYQMSEQPKLLFDHALWDMFTDMFNDWTINNFKVAGPIANKELRHVLRQRGVYVEKKQRFCTATALYNCSQEIEPEPWPLAEAEQAAINGSFLGEHVPQYIVQPDGQPWRVPLEEPRSSASTTSEIPTEQANAGTTATPLYPRVSSHVNLFSTARQQTTLRTPDQGQQATPLQTNPPPPNAHTPTPFPRANTQNDQHAFSNLPYRPAQAPNQYQPNQPSGNFEWEARQKSFSIMN